MPTASLTFFGGAVPLGEPTCSPTPSTPVRIHITSPVGTYLGSATEPVRAISAADITTSEPPNHPARPPFRDPLAGPGEPVRVDCSGGHHGVRAPAKPGPQQPQGPRTKLSTEKAVRTHTHNPRLRHNHILGGPYRPPRTFHYRMQAKQTGGLILNITGSSGERLPAWRRHHTSPHAP